MFSLAKIYIDQYNRVPYEDGRLLQLDAPMTVEKLHYPQCITTASDWWITVSTIGLRKRRNM